MAINLCDVVLVGHPDPRYGRLHRLDEGGLRTRCGLPLQPAWERQVAAPKRERCRECAKQKLPS